MMNTTTPFPSEMRPSCARARSEGLPTPKSPFETMDACDTINRIITDLTDRLDPVLSSNDNVVSVEKDVERSKAKLLDELERIAFRLRCLDQRIVL